MQTRGYRELVAEITGKAQIFNAGIFGSQFTQEGERSVLASVVDKNYFGLIADRAECLRQGALELRNIFLFIVDRNDKRVGDHSFFGDFRNI